MSRTFRKIPDRHFGGYSHKRAYRHPHTYSIRKSEAAALDEMVEEMAEHNFTIASRNRLNTRANPSSDAMPEVYDDIVISGYMETNFSQKSN